MKLLQSFPQRLDKTLAHIYSQLWLVYWLLIFRRVLHSPILLWSFLLSHLSDRFEPTSVKRAFFAPAAKQRRSHLPKGVRPPLVMAFTVVSMTGLMGQRFYNAPTLDVGKQAPQTFYAPIDANVEDKKTTDEKRRIARTGAVPVLMHNQEVNQQIDRDLQRAFGQGREFRQMAGSFPFVRPSVLSVPTQLYLRRAEEWEWRTVLEAVEPPNPTTPSSRFSGFESSELMSTGGIRLLTADQKKAVAELTAYRQSATTRDFLAVIEAIVQSRWKYTTAINALPPGEPNAPLYNSTALLDMTDQDWQRAAVATRRVAARILLQGIPQGLPDEILKEVIALNVQMDVPPDAQALAKHFLTETLKPNLIENPEKTRLLAERAAEEVKPEIVSIRQGETIVVAGKTITQKEFALLDYFGMSRRGVNWVGLIGFGLMVSGSITVFWLVERRFHPGLRSRDYVLLGLLTASTPLLLVLGVSVPNLPLVGLLVGSFYGSVLGALSVGLLTLTLPVGMSLNWGSLIASAVGGILGGLLAGKLRSREELALLGSVAGLLQGAVYLMLSIVTGPAWYTALGSTAMQGLTGLVWSIVALGLSPYLERFFDLITPIRLAELSNPNLPLLKRLASEAPGTFQHTLFVSSLAEAATRALGGNVELVRAGALYHDIGKLHDPLGFIENQMGGPNKHDQMDDPYKSAEIIKKHVSEGLVMARKYRLPKAIQAFIPEHQGTMLIAYFYHQASQRSQQSASPDNPPPPVREADFRYDGPIPQSRETGILMLADSCEAALRSLRDANCDEAMVMINKILRARWQDNQLVDSGLTREDLSQIATIFVQVWQQFNHQRIAYPRLAPQQPATVSS